MAIIEVFEYTYRLDGQVCFEFGIVDFLFINLGVVNPFKLAVRLPDKQSF